MEFTALDDNVGEVEEMDFEGVEHAFSCDNNLFRLLFYWQGSDQSSHFLGSLPLGELEGKFNISFKM